MCSDCGGGGWQGSAVGGSGVRNGRRKRWRVSLLTCGGTGCGVGSIGNEWFGGG